MYFMVLGKFPRHLFIYHGPWNEPKRKLFPSRDKHIKHHYRKEENPWEMNWNHITEFKLIHSVMPLFFKIVIY